MPYVRDTGGICPICNTFKKPLEYHHCCYNPERGIRICHNCHFKIHFRPNLIAENVKIMLEQVKGEDCNCDIREKGKKYERSG